MREQFGRDAVYPTSRDMDHIAGAVTSVDRLLERWQKERDTLRVIAGHFPLCTTALLDAEFETLTVLREPVERTLSLLRRHRAFNPEHADWPLEAIYDDPGRFERLIHNHMVKMLALTTQDMTAGMLTPVRFTQAHLDRAKEQLEQIDVVGIQERLDDLWDELHRRFGWNLTEPLVTHQTDHVDVSDALRERIAEDNALDVELYECARQLVGKRSPV
jgi:hypothetical protein